jgi:hypothetical protein
VVVVVAFEAVDLEVVAFEEEDFVVEVEVSG